MGDYHTESTTSTTTVNDLNTTNGQNGAAPESLSKKALIDRTVDALLTPPKSVYSDITLELPDRYIDEPRSLRVAVVGAGLSGVLAGILLPAKVPNIQLTIFEKNADVGGTWFENIYPGVRCDVPAHVYQSTFDPNTQWTEEFAQGPEIRDYWQGLARKYDVYKHLQLAQRVEGLNWVDSRAVWQITVRDLKTDSIRIEEAEFVLTAIGRFNEWKLPNYPGIHDYKGVLRHASNWDPSFDPRDKKVAVIGNGASGIQLTSNLHKVVARLDHYARNKTWVTASFAGDETSIEPIPISEELRAKFLKDPEAYLAYRKEMESKYFRHFNGWLKGSSENEEAREKFRKFMNDRLTKKPELVDALIPDFSPHCRRLTPGPGYFEAITSEKTEYIQTRIRRFTETGIETEDGRHRAVDAVFCATGANVDMVPPFPITARGEDLTKQWREGGKYGYPYTYLGSATPGFPNLLFIHGPNGSGRSGTVPHNVENQITYFARILRKASREGIKSVQPSKRAADWFTEYSDAFFATTVLSENCSSWYNSGKPGSRVHGLWPGSASLATIVQREPRWEDFEYEYLGDAENPFLWYFGKGCTRKELDPEADVTPYLKPYVVDPKDVHESWHTVP
ncbi:4-hydroxyacetophenone monooxygenase [Colletotrichum karsti]|uniref:4-hydroxyacetophenone monooxygenase n=1 Tax=Colletotrichum karsti TaxID=1095194 RepID=A0A9P6I6F1_9PEZI|nr:4-hydroxyacetophenone monooxygenase [Colletotrichum karsti]KAF9876607.1 4-hydroxyacetophenone monooxygenase [Colletotrichum karsti]